VSQRPRAIVYIDGFNLYKNALRGPGAAYKWLDVQKLADDLFPQHEVVKVRYFTAELKPREDDPQIVARQRAYLRALETLASVSIHLGHFQFHKSRFPVHPVELDGITGRTKTVMVKRPEEKGSDVNLASHMLVDAFSNRADIYVVISNDSDFAEPLRLMSEELGKTTGIVFPTENVSKKLLSVGPTLIRHLREGPLSQAQLPNLLLDTQGREICKPKKWKKA
jgi:uncharacterized LabA/DUF88 family protein